RLSQNTYHIELGFLYRRTQGMIMLIPVQPPFAQYQNLENVRGYGFDIDMDFQLLPFISLSANATWMNNRMHGISTSTDRWKEGSRLRNSPFFYYNLGLKGGVQNLFGAQDNFRYYFFYNFIREFYLDF